MMQIKLTMKMLLLMLSVAVFSGCSTRSPEKVYVNEKCTVETPERLETSFMNCTALYPPKQGLTPWIDCVTIKTDSIEADYQASNNALKRCK